MTSKPVSKRILTFDLLRGYFLVAIILNHLYLYPNGLDWVAMRGNLYVSAAEGFFLLSGIVLGMVRGAKLIDKPFKLVAGLLLKRGLVLYIASIVLVLAFSIVGWLYGDTEGVKAGLVPFAQASSNPLEFIFQIATFQYTYGWADYLRLYCLFLLFSPLAMWLLRRGWWYIVLLASAGVWILMPSDTTLSDTIQLFWQPLSWQLIFFGGMVIGFHWSAITAWWSARSKAMRNAIISSVVTIAAISLMANIFVVYGAQGIIPVPADLRTYLDTLGTMLHRDYFDKEIMPIARLAMFMIWFGAAFWAFHRFEKYLMKFLGWLLLPFGQHSLYVYILHAVMLLFVHIYVQPTTLLANFLVTVAVILAIRIALHYKFLMKIIPN